jgi:hypothetical protein
MSFEHRGVKAEYYTPSEQDIVNGVYDAVNKAEEQDKGCHNCGWFEHNYCTNDCVAHADGGVCWKPKGGEKSDEINAKSINRDIEQSKDDSKPPKYAFIDAPSEVFRKAQEKEVAEPEIELEFYEWGSLFQEYIKKQNKVLVEKEDLEWLFRYVKDNSGNMECDKFYELEEKYLSEEEDRS